VLTAFAQAFRTPDLRKKLLFTLGILALFRFGAAIPTPGISEKAVTFCTGLEKSSSAAGEMGVDLWSVAGGRGIFLGANRAPAPVARRQAAESANCATAHRRERLLRKSCAAVNGQESKLRAREIRTSGASAGQPSAPLRPCRPSVLRQWSAAHLRVLRRRDRAPLPRRVRDHYRPRPALPHREVARHREPAAGAKSSGNRPATRCRGAHSSVPRGAGRIAAAENGEEGGAG